MKRMLAGVGVVTTLFVAGCAADTSDGAESSADEINAAPFDGNGTAAVTIADQASTDRGVTSQGQWVDGRDDQAR